MYVFFFLCIAGLIIGILSLVCIYVTVRDKIRKVKGQKLIGTKISSRKIDTGIGSYYHMEVAYRLNGAECRQRLLSTSQKFMDYKINEPIPLLYMAKSNKVYWAKDNRVGKVFKFTFAAMYVLYWAFLAGFLLVALWTCAFLYSFTR